MIFFYKNFFFDFFYKNFFFRFFFSKNFFYKNFFFRFFFIRIFFFRFFFVRIFFFDFFDFLVVGMRVRTSLLRILLIITGGGTKIGWGVTHWSWKIGLGLFPYKIWCRTQKSWSRNLKMSRRVPTEPIRFWVMYLLSVHCFGGWSFSCNETVSGKFRRPETG